MSLIFLGVVCARADNILTVNGMLHPFYADLNGGGGGTAFSTTGWFHWTDTYTNYSGTQQGDCNIGCRTDYTADLNGGNVTGSYTIQNQTYLLQGQIVSGHISGISCLPEYGNQLWPPQGNHFTVDIRFLGAWSNGWLAAGEIGGSGSHDWGIGSYRIDTQSSSIPEPATFLLFGSSTLILTGVVRHRLRM